MPRTLAPAARSQRVLFACSAADPAVLGALREHSVEVQLATSQAEVCHGFEHWRPTCMLVDVDQIELGDAVFALCTSAVQPVRLVLLASPAAFFVALDWIATCRADHVLMKPASSDELVASITGASSATTPRLPSIDRVQWEYIQAVLGSCHGNVSEAARQLGMFRQSLQRMLRRHPPRS